jgi:hypothetical protein
MGYFWTYFPNKLPKVNYHPIGEKSPYLVTLVAFQAQLLKKQTPVWQSKSRVND